MSEIARLVGLTLLSGLLHAFVLGFPVGVVCGLLASDVYTIDYVRHRGVWFQRRTWSLGWVDLLLVVGAIGYWVRLHRWFDWLGRLLFGVPL